MIESVYAGRRTVSSVLFAIFHLKALRHILIIVIYLETAGAEQHIEALCKFIEP